jgi:hypothetical protein
LPGGATRHLHGTPVLWRSAVHGLLHFVGGENNALRAWTLAADGSSIYQAGSDEIASAQARVHPAACRVGASRSPQTLAPTAIIVAMIPYTDRNMT